MIAERDKDVLRDVVRIAAQVAVPLFVIGAGARYLVHDWPRGLRGGRGTTDWDIAVRVASWSEYERLKGALTAPDAPFEPCAEEHKLMHAGGRRLDLVPYGDIESPDRSVTYPDGKSRQSVLGLRECEASCVDADLGHDLTVRVVDVPGLVVLKAHTYLERRPVKTHDIEDLDFIVSTYGEALDLDVVLERAADVLRDEVVDYADVGAYVLGQEVRALALGDEVLAPLLDLLQELADPASVAVDRLIERSSLDQPDARRAVVRRYAAFRTGLHPSGAQPAPG